MGFGETSGEMRGCLPPESGLGPAAGVKRNLGAGLEKTV